MDNDSVVEQIVRSLSFEVEAIPQENIIQLTTSTKSAPLNVRIRVRKKENADFQHGILSLPKPNQPDSSPERVRLVSSDKTIMSFDVVMEADFQKSSKKPRKNIMSIFKPTICMGAQPDDDKYAYLPNKTYKAKICQESSSKSQGALTKFTLTKNMDNDKVTDTQQKKNKDIFGKCKPGGCLDPPFGEDIHPYSLAQDFEQKTTREKVSKRTDQSAKQTSENKVRTSSILSNKLFNRKKKNSNDETLDKNVIKKESKADYVLNLYQAGRSIPTMAYSNSIMTYPPTLNSSEQLQIQEEKPSGSRIYSDTSKNSVNEHSGSYFIMPKKKKDVLEKTNTFKIEDDVNMGDSNVIKMKTKPEDKNTIAQHQNLDENKKKIILRTRESATDIISAEKYWTQSSGSKDLKILIQKPIDNLASITTKLENDIEYTESQKQEDFTFLKPERVKPSIPIPIPIVIPFKTEKEPEGAQQLEYSPIVIAENTKPNKMLFEKDKEYTESEKQDVSTFRNKEHTELHQIPPDKDKKKLQEQKKSTFTEKKPELNNIPPEKNTGHKEIQKQGDSTLTITKRTEPNNILVSERNEETKKPQQQEDSTSIKREDSESNNIPPEKYVGQKETTEQELQKQEDSIFLKTERSKTNILSIIPIPIIIPSEAEKEPRKEQRKEDFTFTKTERSELNNIIPERDDSFKDPQKQVDPTLEKTDLVKLNNTSLTNHEVHMAVPNQDLIFQKSATTSSNITLKKQDILDYSKPGPDEDLDDLQKSTNIIINNRNTNKKDPETVRDYQKPALINEPTYVTSHEDTTNNIVLTQIVEEKKSGDKSVDDKHSDHGDERFTILPTTIEIDTPLEIIPNESDDLKHLWENRKSYLETEAIFSTNKDELNKQKDSIHEDGVKEKYHHTLNTSFSELKDSNSIKIENENYLIQDKVKKLTPNESETQNENIVSNANSQTKKYGSQFESKDSAHSTLDLFDEIHSVAIQKSEINLFIKQESEKIRDDMNFSQQANPLEETTELTHANVFSNTFVEPLKKTIGNGGDVHDMISEFVKNKDNTQPRTKYTGEREYKPIKDVTERNTPNEPELNENRGKQKMQSLSTTDDKAIATQNAYQNNVSDKHIKKITFDNDFKADDRNCSKSEFNSGFQAASKGTGSAFEVFQKQVPNENNLSQTPVTKAARHKTRPIVVNLAIQSYVDDNNQVIIKSFDVNNLPKRYPHDSVKITKRYIETDDEIHIPIDSENDLCLQIKNNKERDINEVDNYNKDPDITGKNVIVGENLEDELDQIKRNVIIADDIRKTLVAVYEQELLPLRNTIAELKDNMEMLAAKHLLMKGHMFIRKSRSIKLVPLYRKCSCIKK